MSVIYGKVPKEGICPKCNNEMDSMGYEGSYICPVCKYQTHKIIIQRKDGN